MTEQDTYVFLYKQKLNFATWWRYISGRKVVENGIYILKWHHQLAQFIFSFIQSTRNRGGALQNFCVDLKTALGGLNFRL